MSDRVGTTFGPYELRRLIGRGGMGEVYEAYDRSRDRTIALKLLPSDLAGDPSYQERFRREAQTAARLQDPHIIPIHDFGSIDDVLYIDMRLVQGVDLRHLLRSGRLMQPSVAVDLARQIGSALDAAHRDGLVHRDVKPENVLITPDGFAYLADFGIAARADDERLTQSGSAVGSLAYMAPERFTDEPVRPSSDIYSLGCLLYEMLTGRSPFLRGNAAAMIAAQLNDTAPPASKARVDLPSSVDPVLARSLSKDASQRYPTATALVDAVGVSLAGPRGATGGYQPPPRPDAATVISEVNRLRSGPAGAAGFGGAQSGMPTGQARSGGAFGGEPAAYRWGSDGGSGGGGARAATQPQRRRTPAGWIIGAVAAVLVAAVVVAAIMLWPKGSNSSAARDTSTGSPTSSGSTSTPGTGGTGTSSSPPTDSGTSTPTSTTPAVPAGNGYDAQGWNTPSTARCVDGEHALLVAASTKARISICEAGDGSKTYRAWTTDGNHIAIPNPYQTSGGWTVVNHASNGTFTYVMTRDSLRILRNGVTQVNESMNTFEQAQ